MLLRVPHTQPGRLSHDEYRKGHGDSGHPLSTVSPLWMREVLRTTLDAWKLLNPQKKHNRAKSHICSPQKLCWIWSEQDPNHRTWTEFHDQLSNAAPWRWSHIAAPWLRGWPRGPLGSSWERGALQAPRQRGQRSGWIWHRLIGRWWESLGKTSIWSKVKYGLVWF